MIAEDNYFYTEINGVKYRGFISTWKNGVPFGPTTVYLTVSRMRFKRILWFNVWLKDWSHKIWLGRAWEEGDLRSRLTYNDGVFWIDTEFVKSRISRAISMYHDEVRREQENVEKFSQIRHEKII
jgi:hypothetical protein